MLITLPDALGLHAAILFPLDSFPGLDSVFVIACVAFAGVAINNPRKSMANAIRDLTFIDGPDKVLGRVIEVQFVMLLLVPIEILDNSSDTAEVSTDILPFDPAFDFRIFVSLFFLLLLVELPEDVILLWIGNRTDEDGVVEEHLAILVPLDSLDLEETAVLVAYSHFLEQTWQRILLFLVNVDHAFAVNIVPSPQYPAVIGIKYLLIVALVILRKAVFEIVNLWCLTHVVDEEDFEDGAIEVTKV